MFFAYTLQSAIKPDQFYVGLTTNLEFRLKEHNLGKSVHTNKFKPWELISYTAFLDKSKAVKFEIYLKSSSGRAFARKRL